MKKLFLLLLVAQSANFSSASDDFETGGSSKALFFFNQRLVGLVGMKGGGLHELENTEIGKVTEASNELKDMVAEAQKEYQIPAEQRLPVYQVEFKDSILGRAKPNAIFLSKQLLTKSYGAQRFTVYHEVAHTQYCDEARSALRLLGSLAVAGIVLTKTFPGGSLYTMVLGSCGVLACTFLGQRLATDAKCKDERRADEQAARACKCFTCVTAKAEVRSNTIKGGYLIKDELLKIARRHEDNSLLCRHHKKDKG